MIFLLLQIALGQTQIINVDFAKGSQWSKNESNTYNSTFKVSSSSEKYIYVNVKIPEPNSNLLLVSQKITAVANFYGPFEQGSTVDMISALENRSTRFLKIENPTSPVYISIFDSTIKLSYTVTIEASSEEKCDNDCSNNGICNEGGCECEYNYIGNNCNREANEILESEDAELYLNNEPIFFYIKLDNYQGKSLQLTISTDSYEGVIIYVQKSEANYIPDSQPYNQGLVDSDTVFDSRPINMNIDVPENVEPDTRLVFLAVSVTGNYNTIASSLDISLQIGTSDDSTLSTNVIIIIVVTISVAIIVIAITFCIVKTIKKRRLIESTAQTVIVPILQTELQPVKVNIENALIDLQAKQINPDETCSICLESLNNGKELNQTICKHNFHHSCIVSWAVKHTDCPICRHSLINKSDQNQQ